MSINKSETGQSLVRAAVAAVLGSIAFAVTMPVSAADASAGAKADDLEEVQVTGTRIQRKDFVSPNPITTFDSADLEKLGIVNVSDAMTQIPQNVSQFTPANTGGSAFFVGSTLANLRGLNPFFGTRTLTLVDSRRFIATTQGDAVDLNFIPSNLIQRMEVVTGGASAAYGSGAISGVVNVMLDKRLEGIKVDADWGTTTHGDGDNYHVGIAGGTKFADGRGHIIAGGEYQKSDAIQSCADARAWCGRSRGFFSNNTGFSGFSTVNGVRTPNPITPKIPGLPDFNIMDNLRTNQASKGGVIYNGAVNAASTWQFDDAGTGVTPFAIGLQGYRAPGGTTVGGDGVSVNTNLTLYPDVERKTFFSHADYDFTDKFSGYAELSYGKVDAVNHQWGPNQNTYNICIRADNAYLGTLSTAARNAITAAANNSGFTNFFNGGCLGGTIITKNFQGQNDQTVTTDTKVLRGVVGLAGKFFDTWSWDAYYQYGKTTRDQIGQGYHTNWRFTMAVDAVIDNRAGSATLGQPICRAVRDNSLPASSPFGGAPVADPSLRTGCQPLNPFGTSNASAASLAYAFAPLTEHDNIRQDVFAASTSGELWQGWGAGALSGATGIEYRRDQLDNSAGDLPLAVRTDFDLQYGDSFAGKTEVTEGFAELEMPFLKDAPLAKSWNVNAAVRYAHYKTASVGTNTLSGTSSSNVTTYKFASVWDPIEGVRIRGSYSRDLRAPSFRELFYSQSIPPGGIFGSTNNPWIVVDPTTAPVRLIQNQTDASYFILHGNPDVKPEKATTKTLGFVLSPGGWAERMHFSADYYEISLKDSLSLGGGAAAVQACFDAVGINGNPITSTNPYCQQVTWGPPLPSTPGGATQNPYSNITSFLVIYHNNQPYRTKGIDFSWDYSMPLANMVSSASGNLALRLSATHTIKTLVPLAAGPTDVAGQTGGDQGFLSDFAASPDWSANLTASYANGPFTVTWQTRWVSDGVLDMQNPKTGPDEPGYNPINSFSVTDNTVPNYFQHSLNGSYDINWKGVEKLQVYASINNIFDKDPPFSAGGVGGANALLFDALGRTYRLGFRMKL